VRRLPDGKVFHSSEQRRRHAEVDSLEIAREWEWTVSDGTETATGRFRTEDQGPRLIRINGVANARDIGGWIGLGGRRIKQGLLFRSAGLNDNAPIEYYSLDEIKKLHAEGRLAGMGKEGKTHADQLDRGEKLREKVSDVPGKIAGCVKLTPDEAVTLYRLLYKVLGNFEN
jgi:hypothetical protein